MNWLICGTIPDANFPLSYDSWKIKVIKNTDEECNIFLESEDGKKLGIERGTAALVAATIAEYHNIYFKKHGVLATDTTIKSLLVGDTGDGVGSKQLYNHLCRGQSKL